MTDAKYTVQGVSPNGTTIDLFDYWTANTEAPSEDDNYNYNGGINNDHQLKFNTGTPRDASDVINSWTNAGNGPRTGIVKNTLVDGYPSIAAGTISGWVNLNNNNYGQGGTQVLADEPLAYLFDDSSQAGKQGYYGVQGLLQVDSDGYYYYNASSEQTKAQGGSFESANYAAFDSSANTFTLYNTWGVMHEGTNSPNGQFFPFNNAADVFTENGKNSALVQKDVKASSNILNHYFGMHMSTQFVQQYGGHVNDAEDADKVTYEFSGDDDVWIYIDDVLVGDLGGIHDAARITIDFSTGEIKVTASSGDDVTPDNMKTLRACYQNARAENNVKWSNNGSGSTFADETYHTLDFFYLERGNNDSNMSLRYNLVSIPETELSKVDQEGNFIDGATFNVYDTTNDKEISDENLICEGVVTEKDGTVTLIGQDDYPITLDRLWADGVKNITLVETDTPDGYRAATEIPLYIQHYDADQTANGKETNLLLSSDPWTTGAYAQPKVTATTTSDVQIDRQDNGTLSKDELQSGVLFAVIEQQGSDGKWYPVTGDALSGWNVSKKNAMSDIIAAGKSTNAVFTISTSGAYQTEIKNLPGRIQDYEFFKDANSKSGTSYRGAYYYTTASTLAGATEDNTYAVTNPDTFDRQFSARIYLSNILNRVLVQKTDENGNAVDGATMSLFKADQVNVAEDGSVTLKDDVTAEDAIQTDTTRTLSKKNGDSIDLGGAVIFTELEPGTYYVVETAAPSSYALNQNFAKIIVDDTGVYADAGTDGDGVSVTRGVGRIVRSMVQFATADDVDATLHDIVATPQLREQQNDGSWKWVPNGSASTQHLEFADDGDAVLDYEMMSGGAYTVEAGVPGLSIEQCDIADHATTPRQDISANVTNLFTGVTIVHIKDQQVGALNVTKVVTGQGANQDATFDFTVTFVHPAEEGQEDTIALTQDEATAAGMRLAIGDGEAADVTVGEDGAVTFQLEAGQTAQFTNIPAGVTYQVTEEQVANFKTLYDDNQIGTIEFNETATTTVTNTWAPSAMLDGATNLVVTKRVVGTDWDDGWSFDFTIAPYGEETEEAVKVGTVTMPNPASISISATDENGDGVHQKSFGNITFSAEGTYQFVVTENDFSIEGLSKDESQKVVTVSVAPNQMTGQLEATLVTTGDDASDALVFTNTYKATTGDSGAANVSATKTLTGRGLQADEFSFAIAPRTANGLLDPVATAKNTADGTVSFGSLGYTTADEGTGTLTSLPQAVTAGYATKGVNADGQRTWTLNYTAYEVTNSLPAGVSANASSFNFTVTVVDSGDGTLTATANLPGGGIAFTNTYSTGESVEVAPSGSKSFVYADGEAANPDLEGLFTFTLSSDDPAAPMPEGDGATATNDVNGNVTFGAISFDLDNLAGVETAADGSRSKTFTYTVTESGSVESVTNDATATRTFTITLTDDGKGNLTAVADPVSGPLFAFVNTYTPTSTSATIEATKVLKGAELTAGRFTFELTGSEGAPMPNEKKVTNDENGKVTFGPITFTTAGEYDYTITEVNDRQSGVSYDKIPSRTVHVSVTDDGQGQLVATVTSGGDDLKFTNTYTPPTTPPGEHEPEKPNTPEPEEPETPTTPEEPTTPETPETPEQPETPETPVTPENPSTPSTPEQPVKPEQPTETLPSTGDAMLGAVIATAAIGVACLGAAHVIRKRGER
ncbi:FctA domain-containing protein [Collinsella sp. An2]|uniref:Spy0128 family protein n=1 Tax=Collinsella sp. An2 TaxID=1965585 RepID=UPI000B3AC9F8|nr:FctA domain-containing protein [Collinsella sp. An2]